MEKLKNLFEVIKKEASNNIVDSGDDKKRQQFPIELFNSIWDSLLNTQLDESVLTMLESYLVYDDLRFFTLKYLSAEFYAKNECSELCMENLLALLSTMPGLEMPNKPTNVPESTGEEEPVKNQNGKLFALQNEYLSANSKITQNFAHRKLYTECLNNFLSKKISLKLYKKVLVKLPEKILPKMSNPLTLASFLTSSYNLGGLVSVLALNSLFILINNYNLEYPNFYLKVYQLIDASVFYTKYKDKFFQLLDIFLMSTHLSASLVAAFIKKLSRLSLTCPPADLKFLILFIYNLLIRHPNCKILIHNNRKTKEDIIDDPYDVECNDFNKCNALKSSLWEIQSLKNHYAAYVSKEVEKLNNLNANMEYQLDEAFENNSYDSIIGLELDSNKATANCALNYFFKLNDEPTDSNYYDMSVSTVLKI